METIELNARYGYKHRLEHVGGNLWNLIPDEKSSGYFRIIGNNPVVAIDPDGGPFLSVGSIINNKKIKSITLNGIIELEDYEES